ncbi:MAG: outer membrane beta-barrel protein [Methylovirgula sp.]
MIALLIYGTGGGAYGNFHTSYNGTDFFNTGHFGWTAGGGIEYAIDNNWSVRAEYRYTDYGPLYRLAGHVRYIRLDQPPHPRQPGAGWLLVQVRSISHRRRPWSQILTTSFEDWHLHLRPRFRRPFHPRRIR